MTVQVKEDKSTRARKDSAVVSRERLRRQRGAIERFTAWGVLAVSFLGSVVTFYGGWSPLIAGLLVLKLNAAPILLGVGLQLLLTFLEWHYFDQPIVAWLARVVDAATTALGYGPLLYAPLAVLLTTQVTPDPFIPTWIAIGLVSLLVAWYPENRLVD